jgi:hypothetical protein
MFVMFFHILRVYRNIVNEDHDKLIQLGHETEFMRYKECAGAFVNPNDMTRYSYKSYLIEKAILGKSLA